MNTSNDLIFRKTVFDDLQTLFIFQLDEEACRLAAFTPTNSNDKAAYLAKYGKFLDDPTINMKTIFADDKIIGSIAKFEIDGKAELTYWIDKAYWGKGVASKALAELLATEKARPICGRVAFDNIASQRVLEKAGFVKVGTDKGFANARQEEIEEFIYKLL